jgi:hypothetical protein
MAMHAELAPWIEQMIDRQKPQQHFHRLATFRQALLSELF